MDEDLAEKLKRKADLICILIFCPQISDTTIDGERKLLRQWCRKFLPQSMDLYDRVYEASFTRLMEQFRHGRA